MQGHTFATQFKHGSQDGKAASRLLSQEIQSCQNSLGGCVVGLIHHGETTHLKTPIPATGNINLEVHQRGRINAQAGRNGTRQQPVTGVMATLQRHAVGGVRKRQRCSTRVVHRLIIGSGALGCR